MIAFKTAPANSNAGELLGPRDSTVSCAFGRGTKNQFWTSAYVGGTVRGRLTSLPEIICMRPVSDMPGIRPGATVRGLAAEIGAGAQTSASKALGTSQKLRCLCELGFRRLGSRASQLPFSNLASWLWPVMGVLDESPEDELRELLSCHRSDLGLHYRIPMAQDSYCWV